MLEMTNTLSERKTSGYAEGGAQFGSVVYSPGGTFGPRAMRHYQLVFVLEGSAQYFAGGKVHEFGEDEGVLCKPDRTDRFVFARDRQTRHTWCEISAEGLEPPLREALEKVETQTISATQRMGWIVDMGLNLPAGSRHSTMSRHLAHVVFWEYVRLVQLSGGRPLEERAQHPAVQRATAFIESHFTEPLDSDDIAREARLTAQHLRTLFQDTLNRTPLQYLWKVRLDHARRLVTGTGLTFSEISDACGFANPYHFSRKFRETYGQSPADYRKHAWRPR